MTFSRIPRVAVGASVAGAAAIVIGIGAFAAEGGRLQLAAVSSPSPSSQHAKSEAYCGKFLSHLASNLGKSQSEVTTAIGKSVSQTIDDAVAAGDLTKAQADQIKAKLANASACSGPFAGHFAFGHRGHAELPAVLDAAAKSLNLTTAELKTDLANGQTLHQIADSKGISESQFRAALIKNLTPALDSAVSQGKLTKTQETEILQRLQTGPIPFWDASMNRHREHGTTVSPSPTA